MSIAEAHRVLTKPGAPFELEVVTINKIPYKLWKQAPKTFRQLWLNSAKYGPLDYLVLGSERWTYTQSHNQVNRIAHLLIRSGCKKGDFVGIAARNIPTWVFLFWAIECIGGVAVCLNAFLTGGELSYCIEKTDCKMLFMDAERWERVRHVDGFNQSGTVQLLGLLEPGIGLSSLDELMRQYSIPLDCTMPDIHVHPEDPACVFFTSGTR